MRGNRRSRPVPVARRSHRLSRVHRRQLASELLETRCMLAQTTGLFFHEAAAEDGYVLFSPNTANTTFLINKDGQLINSWESNYVPGLVAHLQPDGSLIRDSSPHGQGGNGSIEAAGAGGLLERFEWDGTKTWEFAYDSPQHLAHHDFEIMPNGNILLIAWEYKSEAEATQAGRDPSLPGDGYLYPDHIVEVQPDYVNGGGTIVWQWHVWDHLVQDFDPTKSNYYGATGVETNPQLIDVNYVSTFDAGGGQAEDWTHANGIDYNADLDQIALSVREFSEIWIIDHSTTTAQAAGHTGGNGGHGGDLLYRWGNPQTYGRGTAADRQLYYQHDVRWIESDAPGAGHLTVFNNGVGRPGTDFSQVVEWAPPVQPNGTYSISAGQAWGPTAPTWTYDAPAEDFSAIISGATRLANGNTLVTFGVRGDMTEVTPAGEEVWKYVNPYAGDVMLGMEDPVPPLGINDPLLGTLYVNFVFQAQHYSYDYLSQLTSSTTAHHIFYNHSVWDGNNTAIEPANDAAAIATDKTPYLPGSGVATFDSITSFSRGITGIMIDLSPNAIHTGITANDFVFKVGNNNSPDTWAAAPTPSAVSVVPGGGVGGTDRVIVTWPSGSIRNQWLEVQLLGNSHTGLLADEVVFWGNKIGDSGTSTPAGAFSTTTTDSIQVFSTLGAGKPITDLRDYNRDGQVTTTDSLIVFSNLGSIVRLDIPGAGPFAPVVTPAVLLDDRAAAVASALSIVTDEDAIDEETAEPGFVNADAESPARGERYLAALVADRPVATQLQRAAATVFSVTDQLLDDLLAKLPF